MADGGPPDPNAPLAALTSVVAEALEALAEEINAVPLAVSLEVNVPTVDSSETHYSGSVSVTLKDSQGPVAVGQLDVLTEPGMPPAHANLELTEGTVTRRLTLLLGAPNGDGILLLGFLLVDDGVSTTVSQGGWLYSAAAGLAGTPGFRSGILRRNRHHVPFTFAAIRAGGCRVTRVLAGDGLRVHHQHNFPGHQLHSGFVHPL